MSLINDYLKKTQVEAPPQDKMGDVPPALKSSAKTRDWASILRVAAVVAVVSIAGMVYLVVHSTTQKMTLPPDLMEQPPEIEVAEVSPAPLPAAERGAPPVPKGTESLVSSAPVTAPQELSAAPRAQQQPNKKSAPAAPKNQDIVPPVATAAPAKTDSPEIAAPAHDYPPVRVAPIAPPVVTRTVEVDQDHYYQLGLMAQKQGDYRDAEKHYRGVLVDNPAHIEALTNLAAVYVLQNNYPEARTILDRILRLDPHNTKALVNLGIISLKTGEPETAERKFQEALSIDPDEETALTNLAYLAKQKNDLTQLEGYYKKLLAVAPDNVEIIFAYASLLEQGSRFSEASSLYQKSLDLDTVKANRPLMQQITDRIGLLRSYAQRQ